MATQTAVVLGTLATLGLALLGCTESPETDVGLDVEDAIPLLERTFGSHAELALRGGDAVPLEEGHFVSNPANSTERTLRIDVPRQGGPIRLRLSDGFEVQVQSALPQGPVEQDGRRLVASRPFGASVWSVEEDALEEWLFLPDGAPGREVASYQLSGGEPCQHGRAIDIYDGSGRARITMSAPSAIDVEGTPLALRLDLRGTTAVLTLDRWTPGPLLVDPVFVVAGSMSQARVNHSAVRMPSGRVLAVGGRLWGALTDLATAELFDPATDTWSPAATATHPHADHDTALLPDGRAVIFDGDLTAYDENTDQWSVLADLSNGHTGPPIIPLADGRLLVAGGGTKLADIYDPIADQWTPAAPLLASRIYHKAVRLLSGHVLVVDHTIPYGEVYDPEHDTWTQVPNYPVVHGVTNPVLLPDGRALFVSASIPTAVDAYDEVSATWTTLAPNSLIRSAGGTLLLADGLRVLTVGGQDPWGPFLGDSEVYDIAGDSWSVGAPMHASRYEGTFTLLANEKVLAAGGIGEDPVGTDPKTLRSAELLGLEREDGAVCQTNSDCASAHCADGVCCETACTGQCFRCSVQAGSLADGICSPVDDIACDDGDGCTLGDTCLAGQCGGLPKDCPSPGVCWAAECKGDTGECVGVKLYHDEPCPGGTCGYSGCEPSTTASSGAGDGTGTGDDGEGGGDPRTGEARGGACAYARKPSAETPSFWFLVALAFVVGRRRRPGRPFDENAPAGGAVHGSRRVSRAVSGE